MPAGWISMSPSMATSIPRTRHATPSCSRKPWSARRYKLRSPLRCRRWRVPAPATSAPPDPAAVHGRVFDHVARASRDDLPLFCSFVLRDEKDGSRLQLAPMHREMLQLAQERERLAVVAHAESGKTALLGVGHLLWRRGRDRSLRTAIISNAHSQAARILRTISGYITRSRELHAVFPRLRAGVPWTDASITIERPVLS